MEYRKKPVVIEAFQWRIDEVPSWWKGRSDKFEMDNSTGSVFIATMEGVHEARVNDFIIKGVKDELYPCKPDIFKLTYEPLK